MYGGGGRWGNEEFEDTDDRVWNEVFAKNVEISYLLTMYVLKEMIPNKWPSPDVPIINIASIFGKESGGRAMFNLSKAAQIALNKNIFGGAFY